MHRRVSADVIQQLVEDYQAGTPSTQLTTKYQLGKGTVLQLLREQGVQLRNQPMTPDQVQQAIQLYQDGLSLVAVGNRLGIDQSTVLDALKRAGIPRRDAHGRER